MEKCFGYCRVSTLNQKEHGYGVQSQEQAIKEFCKNNNLQLVKIFKDEGISGTLIDRPALIDMMSKFNGVRKVVVYGTSRLWRDDQACFYIKKSLRELDIQVISITEPTYTIQEEQPSDILLNSIFDGLTRYERAEIVSKLRRGRITRAKSGVKASGICPLGYKYEGKSVIIDEATAPIIELAFKKYLETESTAKVAAFLNNNGYKTNRGKEFSRQVVYKMLSNDFYKGVVHYGDLTTEGNYKPIINKILYGRVQSALSKNSKAKQIE